MSMRNPSAQQIMAYVGARSLLKSKTQAFREAFPDSKCNDNTARKVGYELSLHPDIIIAMHRLRESLGWNTNRPV